MTALGWIGVGVVAMMFSAVMVICLPDKRKRKRRDGDEQR